MTLESGGILTANAANASAPIGATDLSALVREALGQMEAADMAVEMLASHGITESNNFERLRELVESGLKAVAAIDTMLNSAPRTVFPNLNMARDWCTRNCLPDGRMYHVHPDGAGRCTISISQIVEWL